MGTWGRKQCHVVMWKSKEKPVCHRSWEKVNWKLIDVGKHIQWRKCEGIDIM